ncbi:MAG: heme-binding protein [Rhabdochlamydiaceae bacterium]|jgi:hypothetical protein
MSNVEQPDYRLVTSKENIEIREYPPMILAEAEVSGERKEAIKEGFRILADYIFGNNTSNIQKAPATNDLSEKIPMTAPVIQEYHTDKWKIRFIMPKNYSFEQLPKPNSENVILLQSPAKCFAVIRFSGAPDDENIKEHKKQLEAYILAEKLKPIGGPLFAFYNRPSTPPFLRRNEVMIEIGIDP